MRSGQRYETLDFLRGVAAFAVVVFHLGQVRLAPNLIPHGYLAVDFFFVLSGFVIAYSYESALLGPLSWGSFAMKRVVRLYPLAVLGAALGCALLLFKWHTFPTKVDPLPRIFASGALNALLLPTPFGSQVSRHELFPGDGPMWSLSFEMAANLVWASCGPWLRTRTLAAVVVVAGLMMGACAVGAGTSNLGFDVATAGAGAARVCFGFPLGVLIYRVQRSTFWPKWLPANRAMPALLGVTLIGILALPSLPNAAHVAWDMASTVVFLPMIVVLGIVQGRGGRLCDFLGELSYPIYVLHFPVLLLASGLHQSVLAGVPSSVMAVGATAAAGVLGIAASRLYDIPIRRLLTDRAASFAFNKVEAFPV